MIYKKEENERESLLNTAKKMAVAARTAPKGCGVDNIEVIIVDGKEKDALAEEMRKISVDNGEDFFMRDAACVDRSMNVVLIGVHAIPLGTVKCNLCGFENCGECVSAGANCAFNITDLGIAVGSAVSVAADNRVDNRVFYSAGIAARQLGFMSDDVRVCYGIPLSASGKSVFFDRGTGDIL